MARLKRFRIQKRFEVWLECEVGAKDFAGAVEQGKAMNYADFVAEDDDNGVLDVTEIEGFSVSESW